MNTSTLLRFAPLVIMMAFVYLIIIPENKRKKKYRGMLDSLKVNDEVMTKGGIIGKIINIQANFIILQTGPDKIRIKLDKTGVLTLLSEFEANNDSDKKADANKA